MKQGSVFKGVEKKTGVKFWDILKLANSVKDVNLRDEENVRDLVRRVGNLTNKPVPKEKEDQIVHTILNDAKSINFNTIGKMLEKN
ncbi:stage VI sporulation protein F [Salipaludibacillus sp. HK11]|uniref:stage VI sporulation protein F n=1 Tax=Salipaludibacillus sp. HK11 TaxID=3394320 RepID=UPI0039FD75C3